MCVYSSVLFSVLPTIKQASREHVFIIYRRAYHTGTFWMRNHLVLDSGLSRGKSLLAFTS